MTADVAVLFANDAFYVAFSGRDFDAMEEVWSQREAITCIHPGWAALAGREAVLASWRAILSNPHSPAVRVSHASATVFGETAYVVCYEHLSEATLVATNIFVRENVLWRLVHHQAGVATAPMEPDNEPAKMQ